MLNERLLLQLKKIGIEVFDEDKTISFTAIKIIKIDTPEISLLRKVSFWFNRIFASNNIYHIDDQGGFFDTELDYRYLYELKVLMKNEEILSKYIKDFDLFAVTKGLKLLNEKLK